MQSDSLEQSLLYEIQYLKAEVTRHRLSLYLFSVNGSENGMGQLMILIVLAESVGEDEHCCNTFWNNEIIYIILILFFHFALSTSTQNEVNM